MDVGSKSVLSDPTIGPIHRLESRRPIRKIVDRFSVQMLLAARAIFSVRPLSHVVWKKFARCSGRMLSASSKIA
jgi:hypothetical protein